MEIRKIIAGLILSTLTTLSWADGHGHNLEDCVKKFADAQVGNWEGSFRFWEQAVNQVVDMEFKNSITKTGDDKLKFAMTSAADNATTEQPIASEWSGSPNWIKESSTTSGGPGYNTPYAFLKPGSKPNDSQYTSVGYTPVNRKALRKKSKGVDYIDLYKT